MQTTDEKRNKLLAALKIAYKDKERQGVKSLEIRCQQQVMREIRHIGPTAGAQTFLTLFENLVWRLAPAASVILVVLILLAFNIDTFTESDLATLFFEDPVGYGVLQLAGV